MNFLEYLSINDISVEQSNAVPESLQRTDNWFEARRGRFTGSRIKDLMKCTRSTSKMEWGRPEKLIDFSETALKYVFAKAMERKRGKVVKTATSKAMKYGTENESSVVDLLKEMYPQLKFDEVEFIEFIENVAGASPDGMITNRETIGLEIKCATDWNGLYNRHSVAVDEKHMDFWQLQAEMLALKVNKIMYVVAEPSESIFQPNITDISIQYVDKSDIHQKAIIDRCIIGDKIIKEFLNGTEFYKSVHKVLSE